MSSLNNYYAPRLLDHATGVNPLTSPALWLALSTASMTAASASPTEPSGNGYARESVTMGSAVAGPPASSSNTTQITYTATGSWGTIVAGAILDASTAGNMLWQGDLVASKTIGAGESLQFDAGKITITMA